MALFHGLCTTSCQSIIVSIALSCELFFHIDRSVYLLACLYMYRYTIMQANLSEFFSNSVTVNNIYPRQRGHVSASFCPFIHNLSSALYRECRIRGAGCSRQVVSHWQFSEFLSRVSTLSRVVDIAKLSVRPSVRPSVCLPVTFRYQMKTA